MKKTITLFLCSVFFSSLSLASTSLFSLLASADSNYKKSDYIRAVFSDPAVRDLVGRKQFHWLLAGSVRHAKTIMFGDGCMYTLRVHPGLPLPVELKFIDCENRQLTGKYPNQLAEIDLIMKDPRFYQIQDDRNVRFELVQVEGCPEYYYVNGGSGYKFGLNIDPSGQLIIEKDRPFGCN